MDQDLTDRLHDAHVNIRTGAETGDMNLLRYGMLMLDKLMDNPGFIRNQQCPYCPAPPKESSMTSKLGLTRTSTNRGKY
jgi:hypothetical protein